MIDRVRIKITDEVHTLVIGQIRPGRTFKQEGTRNADGTWSVPVSFELYKRIAGVAFENENINDVLLRVLTTQKRVN